MRTCPSLPRPEYIEILRKMQGEEKLRTAAKMWWSSRNLKKAFLRQQHPDWSEEEIEKRVKEILLYATD